MALVFQDMVISERGVRLSEREKSIITVAEFQLEERAEIIAKRVKLPSATVNYTLRKLIERELIRPRCFINSYQIGLQDIGFFFSLIEQTAEQRRLLVTRFKNHPQIAYFGSLLGDYQYVAVLLCKDLSDAAEILRSLTAQSGDIVTHKKIVPRLGVERFTRKYLNTRLATQRAFELRRIGPLYIMDEVDEKLVWVLGNRPFESMRELARTTGLPLATVDRRIKNLRRAHVIQGFFYDINVVKLGIHSYRVLIEVQGLSCSVREALRKACKTHALVTYLIESLGSWDFEVGIETTDPRQVSRVIEELHVASGRRIASSCVLMELEDYMCRHYPEKMGAGAHRL
jgi:DNA-binding Lrp family transcriptional regulator